MYSDRQLRRFVYTIKRRFGQTIVLTKKATPTLNTETGVQTFAAVESIKVHRAILGSVEWARKFAYDLSYIAALRNFTLGGYFDQSEVSVFVDSRDITKLSSIETDDKMTYKSQSYMISDVSDGGAYVLFVATRQSMTDV